MKRAASSRPITAPARLTAVIEDTSARGDAFKVVVRVRPDNEAERVGNFRKVIYINWGLKIEVCPSM